MLENETVQIFISRVSSIINQIKSFRDIVEDKELFKKFLEFY